MPEILENPHRGKGLACADDLPSTDAASVAALLARCPRHAPTPLRDIPELARACGIAQLWVKDESARMGLGSFKALGAAFVIARDAAALAPADPAAPGTLASRTYVAASAGNHGMSVAAGARVFGARAVIYLADTVPEAFAARLRALGTEVVRAGATYEDSMTAAEQAAAQNGWTLLSDSSWPGYSEIPLGVMQGYLQLAAEAAGQMLQPPTDILLQAGVGGLAASMQHPRYRH